MQRPAGLFPLRLQLRPSQLRDPEDTAREHSLAEVAACCRRTPLVMEHHVDRARQLLSTATSSEVEMEVTKATATLLALGRRHSEALMSEVMQHAREVELAITRGMSVCDVGATMDRMWTSPLQTGRGRRGRGLSSRVLGSDGVTFGLLDDAWVQEDLEVASAALGMARETARIEGQRLARFAVVLGRTLADEARVTLGDPNSGLSQLTFIALTRPDAFVMDDELRAVSEVKSPGVRGALLRRLKASAQTQMLVGGRRETLAVRVRRWDQAAIDFTRRRGWAVAESEPLTHDPGLRFNPSTGEHRRWIEGVDVGREESVHSEEGE